MRRLRRIKILATLGPASSDSAMIRRLFEAGADVFRINMSHTPHDKMRELVKTIRNVESSYGRPIGILVDLQGPKLRLGSFADGSTQLHNGQSFVLDSDKAPGDNTRVQLPHPEILASLKPGHALLLDDGKVRYTDVECHRLPDHFELRRDVILAYQQARVRWARARRSRQSFRPPSIRILPAPRYAREDRQTRETRRQLEAWLAWHDPD